MGHYCQEGSAYPVECPKGTYMASTRWNGNVTYAGRNYYCDLCPPGMSCSETKLEMPYEFCKAGYFCALGTTTTQTIMFCI